MMKILILGGTVFLGRHLVEAALARGHEVTLFNRGQHNPDLFPEVEKLRGNRDGDLGALEGRRWDAVIDTCGYIPRIVRASAELLANAVDHYTFISTISVYSDFSRPNMDENAPLGVLEDPTDEKLTNETYGPLKVLCERAAEEALPGRTLTIRPGLIVGPHDPSDRFTYWPVRAAAGGEALVPGSEDLPVEFIDVRDLAEWNIRMTEAGKIGIYNATGPGATLTMQQMLSTCKQVSGSDARFTYVTGEFLRAADVDPNSVSCWWIDPGDTDWSGVWSIDCRKAIADGLTYRPLADTARATLDWHKTRPVDYKMRLGLEPEREMELLRAWHESSA